MAINLTTNFPGVQEEENPLMDKADNDGTLHGGATASSSHPGSGQYASAMAAHATISNAAPGTSKPAGQQRAKTGGVM
jgi:hypothetical protein